MLESGSYNENTVCRVGAEGNLIFKDQLLNQLEIWLEYYTNLSFQKGCYFSKIQNQEVIVEFEESPLIGKKIRVTDDQLLVELFPGLNIPVKLDSFRYDDDDNFLVLSAEKSIPIFLLPNAQNDFFNCCKSFNDDSFEIFGMSYSLPYLYSENHTEKEEFWSKHYESKNLGWDMGEAHPFLESIVSQVKLMKSRILVLGAGRAHDAHYFAEQGHIVTAVDISEKAIEEAKKLYPESPNLHYRCADAFELEEDNILYDVIWDHTFYCAIPPEKRNELVKLWNNLLDDQGKVLGIFFSMFKPEGPPYGGSERDLSNKTSKYFRVVYWNRIRQGPIDRLGKEFFCYLEKQT